MRIQLVVFDMAGTTVRDDDAVNSCLREALAEVAEVSREDVNRVMGLPKREAIRQLLATAHPGGSAPGPDLVEALHDGFQSRMLRYYSTSPLVEPMPYTLETFSRLKAGGLRLALDTGFGRPIVDAILTRLGWAGRGIVDATVASDEVARGRPHADLIQRAMALTGTSDPRTVAKVGDTPADLLEGIAAGCGLVVGVMNGTHTHEELVVHPHTHLIRDLRELPAILMEESPASGDNPGPAAA